MKIKKYHCRKDYHFMKTALITGATSGIGKATARILAKNNYKLIITGRRKERLEQLQKEIEAEYETGVHVLAFDIQDNTAVTKALASLPDEFSKIDLLINNAGLAAGFGSIHEGDTEDWERMINTNLKGLLYISRAVMPQMVERKSGQIINISSVAGREVYPGGNVYCATKYGVDALTKSMRTDLLPYNIKVSSISPGKVETEFSLVRFGGDAQKAKNEYTGFTPLYAEDIAETVEFLVTRPAHVNINDIFIMPTAQASATQIHRT